MKRSFVLATAVLTACFAQATIVDFDLKPSGFYKPNTGGDVSWQDSGVTFGMSEDLTYGYYWEGFSYSDVNDTTTSGFGNQYAVYGDGMDYSDEGVYAVGYAGFSGPAKLTLDSVSTVDGFYVNNTTYAALSILNGEGFSRAFSTSSNDWFKLTIEGLDASDASVGTVDFLLADYSQGSEDLVSDWDWVDLSSLGSNVTSLAFSLSSSDTGIYGMNTPGYFAMDELSYAAVPEPSSVILMIGGFGGLIWFRRRRKYFFRG